MFSLGEEIRNDYVVTEKRKLIWKSQMEMMEELFKVCKKHDIKCFAMFGTLLGAVRHKGFIPWDDDVDIGLLREDYDKLMSVGADEFSYPFFFQTSLNDTDGFWINPRLRDDRTTAIIVEKGHDDRRHRVHNGIYLDIMPLDGRTEDEELLKKQLKKLHDLKAIMQRSRYNENEYRKEKIINTMARLIVGIAGIENLYKEYERICSKYSKNDTEYTTIMTNRRFAKMKMRSEYFADIQWLDFENIKVPVPCGYKVILETLYGNYETLPPIEDRGLHHSERLIIEPCIPYIQFQREREWI